MKMNIAFLTLCFNIKNYEAMNITTRLLAEEFASKGHTVSIVSHRNPGEKEYENLGRIHIFRPFRRFSLGLPYYLDPSTIMNHFLTQAVGLKKLQRRLGIRFDIIANVISSPTISFRGALARSSSRHAKLIAIVKAKSSFTKLNNYGLLNMNDAVIVSSAMQSRHLKKNGVKKRIAVIGSPIDAEKFRPRNKALLKKRYGYSRKKVILYYGHFNRFKGIPYLINAMPFLKAKDAVLVMIPSSMNEDYSSLIKKQSLQNRIKILDTGVPIEDYVNLADVVVLPYPDLTSTEANPSCLLESMACKTPVVTSDLPELREIVQHGKSAMLAKPKNPEDIAKNIDLLLSDSVLAAQIAENAWDISRKYDVRKIAAQYLLFFNEIRGDAHKKKGNIRH